MKFKLLMVIFYYLLILNLIAFLLIGLDKQLALQQKRRISEKTLLTFVFFGGTIGSGLGMVIFRHKTAKSAYLWKFWGIVVVQIVIVYALFYYGIVPF